MLGLIEKEPGVGLAANQIGILKKIVVVNIENEEKKISKKYALFNPSINSFSKETSIMNEGCLSIPGMLGLVRRYSKIKYSGYDLKGNMISNTAEGLHARVVQHEFDHLNGILYTSRLAHKNAFDIQKK